MTGCPQIFFGSGTPIPPSKIAPFIFRWLFWNYRILLAQDATSKKGLRVHPPNASFCPEVRPEIRKRDSNRWGRSLLMFSAETKTRKLRLPTRWATSQEKNLAQGGFVGLQDQPWQCQGLPRETPHWLRESRRLYVLRTFHRHVEIVSQVAKEADERLARREVAPHFFSTLPVGSSPRSKLCQLRYVR